MTELRFTVLGEPAPAGSRTLTPVYRVVNGQKVPVLKNGRVIMRNFDDNPKTKPWKKLVALAAYTSVQDAREDGRWRLGILEDPLEVEVTFYTTRPKCHYGTGRNRQIVKTSAPAYPTTWYDSDKLERALYDALTGIVYKDDSQICRQVVAKLYAKNGEPARAEVVVRELVRGEG